MSGSRHVREVTSVSRANRREPWGEFADQAIPGLPLSQTSDGNYVASEVVPCVFLAGPASSAPHNAERYRILCGGPHKISYNHCAPSGSLATARHSIGSTNAALRLGSKCNFLVRADGIMLGTMNVAVAVITFAAFLTPEIPSHAIDFEIVRLSPDRGLHSDCWHTRRSLHRAS